MSNRDKFEAWYLENWGHTEDNHETLFERSPDDEYGYYRLGVRMSHKAWQEATELSAKQLVESERYGRQADITIENLERKVEQLAAENAALKGALHPSDIPSEWNDVFGDTAVIQHDSAGDNQGHSVSWSWVGNQEEVIKSVLLAVYNDIKTPSTDAILDEVRAQGVESVGQYLKQYAQGVHEEARFVLQDAGELCNGFAAQLRQEAK